MVGWLGCVQFVQTAMLVGPALAQRWKYRPDVSPTLSRPTLLSDWLDYEEGYPYGWCRQPSQHTTEPLGCFAARWCAARLCAIRLGCVEGHSWYTRKKKRAIIRTVSKVNRIMNRWFMAKWEWIRTIIYNLRKQQTWLRIVFFDIFFPQKYSHYARNISYRINILMAV